MRREAPHSKKYTLRRKKRKRLEEKKFTSEQSLSRSRSSLAISCA